MKKEYGPTQEFWDYCIKVNNPKYKYEIEPGRVFSEEISDNFGIKLDGFCDGPDPPDFEAKVIDIGKVGIEVTSLTDLQVREHGSYYDKVENILSEIIGIHSHFLPIANYIFYYSPGEIQKFSGGHIEIPNYDFKMSLDEMRSKLDRAVLQWFSRYSNDGNRSITISDISGNAVSINMMQKIKSDKKEFFIFPQGIYKYINNNTVLTTELQKAINRKYKKYQGKPWLNEYNQVWLLLYIIGDEMDISSPNIDFDKIRISKKIFNRIFVLMKILTDYKLIELTTDE